MQDPVSKAPQNGVQPQKPADKTFGNRALTGPDANITPIIITKNGIMLRIEQREIASLADMIPTSRLRGKKGIRFNNENEELDAKDAFDCIRETLEKGKTDFSSLNGKERKDIEEYLTSYFDLDMPVFEFFAKKQAEMDIKQRKLVENKAQGEAGKNVLCARDQRIVELMQQHDTWTRAKLLEEINKELPEGEKITYNTLVTIISGRILPLHPGLKREKGIYPEHAEVASGNAHTARVERADAIAALLIKLRTERSELGLFELTQEVRVQFGEINEGTISGILSTRVYPEHPELRIGQGKRSNGQQPTNAEMKPAAPTQEQGFQSPAPSAEGVPETTAGSQAEPEETQFRNARVVQLWKQNPTMPKIDIWVQVNREIRDGKVIGGEIRNPGTVLAILRRHMESTAAKAPVEAKPAEPQTTKPPETVSTLPAKGPIPEEKADLLYVLLGKLADAIEGMVERMDAKMKADEALVTGRVRKIAADERYDLTLQDVADIIAYEFNIPFTAEDVRKRLSQ
jgi:hypothetical protein